MAAARAPPAATPPRFSTQARMSAGYLSTIHCVEFSSTKPPLLTRA
jgi:hypothetical protein